MRNSKAKSERYEFNIKSELETLCGQISSTHECFRDALFRAETTMDVIDREYSISKEIRMNVVKDMIARYVEQAKLLKRIQRRVEGL